MQQRFVSTLLFGALILCTACSTGTGSQHTLSSVLAKIEVSGSSPNIVVGQTEQLSAMGFFADGSNRDMTSAVTWSSSATAVGTITTGGLLNALSSGQTTITATTQGVTGSLSVTVAPALVSIAVAPASPQIAHQTTVQFTATGTYSDNSTQNLTSRVTWSSSNTAVATISTTSPTAGLATGVSAGKSTITATIGSVSGTAMLTVTAASATSITVTPASVALPLGTTQQFSAKAGFSDGTSQDVTGVTQWKSSDTGVASITTSGLATGRNLGSSTISATFEGITGTAAVTVNAANLLSIAITPADSSIAQGTNEQLAAKGTFNDGSTRDVTFLASWVSSNPSAGTVSSSSAIISAVAPGSTTVTATLGSISGSTSVTVTNATIVSVLISPANITIPTGGSVSLSATGVFSDSSTQDISKLVTWTSDSTAVATVGNTVTAGFVKGISAGTANISATFSYAGDTQTGKTVLTVSSATLSSLALTPANAQIAPASSEEYTATGTFSDGSTENMNSLATWTSSDNNVAVVSHPGVLTGESAGTVTVTATDGTVSATANLLVESSALTSISITPQTLSVAAGFQAGLKAVGSFTNGDTQDLTKFVTWTSSNSAAATVSNTPATAGQVLGVAPGSTTVTAIFAGQVGTATITVTNAALNSITVSPATVSLPIGQSKQLSAIGSFSDGSNLDLVGQVTWTSSNPAVATVTAGGVANALTSGTSTISAELDGFTGTAILTVQ